LQLSNTVAMLQQVGPTHGTRREGSLFGIEGNVENCWLLQAVPVEVALIILSKLGAKDLLQCFSMLDKASYLLAHDQGVWHRMLQDKFGETVSKELAAFANQKPFNSNAKDNQSPVEMENENVEYGRGWEEAYKHMCTHRFDENTSSPECSFNITRLSVVKGGMGARWSAAFGNLGYTQGILWVELQITASSTRGVIVGITTKRGFDNEVGLNGNSWGYYANQGTKYAGTYPSSYGTPYSEGDKVGIYVNLDEGELYFYKNGQCQGLAFSHRQDSSFPKTGQIGGDGKIWVYVVQYRVDDSVTILPSSPTPYPSLLRN
jgi:hypothetical protein